MKRVKFVLVYTVEVPENSGLSAKDVAEDYFNKRYNQSNELLWYAEPCGIPAQIISIEPGVMDEDNENRCCVHN